MKLQQIAVGTFAVAMTFAACATAAPRKTPVSDAEIAKINAALPDAAPAKPKKARKVLVYTRATGYYHASIPLGAKTFELMGQRTGAFTAVTSDDPESFDTAKLRDVDAIVMMSNTGELFVDKSSDAELLRDASAPLSPGLARAKELRDSLLAFVRGGKGIVGLHAATDCSYQWPEYGEMMGGYFNGHPWGPVVLRIEEPGHPVNAAFEGKPFAFREEMYTFKPPYSREKLRVLTSIDLAASKIDRGLNRPDDHDYAVSWVKSYGEGRVFYCSFGHGDVSFYDPTILRHFLAGTQFALGDLDADASPSGPLSPSRLAENKRVGDAGFNRVASHDAWYRTRKDVKEEVFAGNLTRVTDDNCFYRLDDTPVFTGGERHALLDSFVGTRVEILGRLITPQTGDDPPKQIWPAQARPTPK